MLGFLPLKYFGLLLRASYKVKSIWDSVIEKIKRQLVNWNNDVFVSKL